jgi:hypothetical protein
VHANPLFDGGEPAPLQGGLAMPGPLLLSSVLLRHGTGVCTSYTMLAYSQPQVSSGDTMPKMQGAEIWLCALLVQVLATEGRWEARWPPQQGGLQRRRTAATQSAPGTEQTAFELLFCC